MSSWETSGESYCNDRSKEFSKNRNILKSIQSILRRKIAYDIMLAGKKRIKVFITKKAKALEVAASRAFFLFHFLLQWTRNHQVSAALFAV
ncbi:hypothetical protein GT718_06770 [Blautia massiliensis]|jgi:hypothetical protein|uniref:Uncharacterized protein n=1 Tax=Blautia massiliensis (ex Durand et al. 2017) TaxID=1737424 RepID=A0ABW9X4W3_9FIRM|nr:hypothetical protein [Blautia massiliensis (ex Durand et al. 2017)]RHU11061.1 hypothetical protein DW694_11520 [Ruminococcus sp. AM26-12LB]RYT38183.1 hypothetical protein EAI83_06765 [Blautia sp. aa_0143]